MILKPFMLRRIKKDVENELSDKVYEQISLPVFAEPSFLFKTVHLIRQKVVTFFTTLRF